MVSGQDFYRRINAQSHTMAEIETLLDGLKVATNCSIWPIEIEMDSIGTIEALQASQNIYSTNINLCRLLKKRLGNPLVWRSFQQTNEVADFLSRLGSKLTPSAQATILSTLQSIP